MEKNVKKVQISKQASTMVGTWEVLVVLFFVLIETWHTFIQAKNLREPKRVLRMEGRF